MKIGFRIIKTAVGAGIAIALAQWLGLAFFTTAGMLTILCIKETKKRSIHSALEKFVATVVGGLFAAAFFQLCGFQPWVIALILLTLIPILVKIQAKDSVATSSVVILHLYMFNEITPSILLNELGIIRRWNWHRLDYECGDAKCGGRSKSISRALGKKF